ncbi:MAG TPA: HEAT repeat domain-containing protein [Verrucomicrobiae bacterium]|jgi:hypothetical protein|nr:HEAT repeat domain-containing protein [Verrucomicrobiae bacterium]
MKKKITRMLAGVSFGMLLLVALVWLLSKTLGNMHYPALYAGRTIDDWERQLYTRDAGASNAAFAVVNSQLVPKFVDTMFNDTNDSPTRLSLINMLNCLPGVLIFYYTADVRRADAAQRLGALGPAARSAVPDLIKAVKGKDPAIRASAISALGKIHSEPETVIPLLIQYLDDDNLDVAAANALAEFGSLAKPAVPKLLPLLHVKDDDDQAAARAALKKIDPVAAAQAENDLRKEMSDRASTNRTNAPATTGAK